MNKENDRLNEERQQIIKGGRLNIIHWFVVLGSLALTFFAWRYAVTQEKDRFKERFNYQSMQVISLVKERMQKYEDALWGGSGAILAKKDKEMDYKSWVRFTKALNLQKKYPGINGIGIIYPVAKEKLDSFVEKKRKSQPDFRVHPKHNRGEFLPITYIEPIKINKKALGLDMAHEDNRYFAAIKSRDTGEAQITGPITLVQDNDKTPGFLFFAPFYGEENPETKEERRKSFKGIVYAPFIVKKLMDGTLAKESRSVSISIKDGDQFIFNEHKKEFYDHDAKPMFKQKISLDFYGRSWVFDVWSSMSFKKNAVFSQSRIILFGGIFIDTLLFLLFFFLSKGNRRVISFADEVTNSLQSRTLELEKANKAKSNFISAMSHELKTPLSTIIGYSELLTEDSKKQKLKGVEEFSIKIQSAGQYLLTLINEVLDMSMIEKGLLRLKKESISTEVFLKDIADMSHLLAQKKKNKFILNNYTTHHHIFVDRTRLKKILLNVIGNSAKFTQNGLIELTLLDKKDKEGAVEFRVKDSGMGIKASKIKNIFKKFVQVHDIAQDSTSGTGLGLSLTKDLVGLMGGRIEVKSQENKGSEFIFSIPVLDIKKKAKL